MIGRALWNDQPYNAGDTQTITLVVAALLLGVAFMTEPTWWGEWGSWLIPTVAIGVAIAILVVALWSNFVRPRIRKLKLKKPCTAHFSTTAGERPTVIEVPKNETVDIQLRILPKIEYSEDRMRFGFIGDPNSRPRPISVLNKYVDVGRNRERSPATTDDFIDVKGNYHVLDPVLRTPGTEHTTGFVIETKAPGEYQAQLYFWGEGVEGKLANKLIVIVK